MTTDLVPVSDAGSQLSSWKQVAEVCKQIVMAASCQIDGRRYVKVEGWQALAAMGQMTPEIEKVEFAEMENPWNGETMTGMRAVAVLRRDSDGRVLSRAQGFCSYQETLTKKDGSVVQRWHDQYAVESMAQTRAISKVCRNKLAFVLVMMNAGLQTTPAEEVPPGGFQNQREPQASTGPVKLQGIVDKAYDNTDNQGTTWYGAEVNGRQVWTKDPQLGQELLEANGTEVIATLKPGKKPNKYQLLSLEYPQQQTSMDDDDPNLK